MLVLRVFLKGGVVHSAIGYKSDLDFLFGGYKILKEVKSEDVNILLEKASMMRVVPRIVKARCEMKRSHYGRG